MAATMNADPRVPGLERRLAQLEQMIGRLRGSQGVSTNFGAASFRTVQLGFAAELTGPWNGTTGYPWKRLFLDTSTAPPSLTNPGIQPTGNQAIVANGDTTLTSGTKGWMEPSPDASGYVFIPENTSGGGIGVADLTDVVGAISWDGRTTDSGGAWIDDGTSGTNNAYPVECDGSAFTPKATATSLIWEEPAGSGRYAVFPIQYADASGATPYPGFLSTTTQSIKGSKEFKDNVIVDNGFVAGGTGHPGITGAHGLFTDLMSITIYGSDGSDGVGTYAGKIRLDGLGGSPVFILTTSLTIAGPGTFYAFKCDQSIYSAGYVLATSGYYAWDGAAWAAGGSTTTGGLTFVKGLYKSGSLTGVVTSVDVSGGSTGLTFSGGPITSSGTITMAGTLAIANGGTGQTTNTAAFDALAPSGPHAGEMLWYNGTNWALTGFPLGDGTYTMKLIVSGGGTIYNIGWA